MASRQDVCLVHLVWEPLGPEALAGFLDVYRRHETGVEHSLLILLNGFHDRQDLTPWRALLEGVEHEELRLSSPMQDLAAYCVAVRHAAAERYCFMNSYSRPAAAGWLAKLDAALAPADVGMVGATGSWASPRSWMAHVLRLPSAYRGVMPPPSVAVEQFMAIEADRIGDGHPSPPASGRARARARLQTLEDIPRQTLPFGRFPSHHLRTNSFMIAGATFARLRLREVRDKHDAYLLENGRRSITRQVQRKGLRTLIVDREGVVYDPEQWHLSRTFWQGDQERLLVGDNQTLCYTDGDADRRRILSCFAWGPQADPVLS